jgi:PTS system galactitol-specific IIC component
MMKFIETFFQGIYNLGPLVMMPIVLFLLGLLFGMGFKKSIRSGLTVGVGFAGIYLVLDFFLRTIGGVGTTLATKYGGAASFTDIGWASFAAIGWASAIGLIFIPVGIVSNLIMLLAGLTKNLSVNIWDYWESIIAGVIVQTLTGSFWLGLIFATLVHIINLKVGDWTYHYFRDYFGFKGIVSYAAGYAEWGIIGYPIAWLLDKIPGLSKVKLTPAAMTKRFGVFGEPIFIGSVIGLAMGLLAGQNIGTAFLLGVNIAAVMYIQPKMISILMEGLIPISDGAKNFLQKRAPGREIFIGLDPAIGTGDATALSVAFLMVPVAVFLAIILPGSKVMPLADLTFIVFFSMWAAAMCKGDILKSFITTIFFTIFAIYSASYTAPVMNALAHASGLLPADQASATVTHFANGFYPHSLIAALLGQLFSGGSPVSGLLNLPLGVILTVVLVGMIILYMIIKRRTSKVVAPETKEVAEETKK